VPACFQMRKGLARRRRPCGLACRNGGEPPFGCWRAPLQSRWPALRVWFCFNQAGTFARAIYLCAKYRSICAKEAARSHNVAGTNDRNVIALVDRCSLTGRDSPCKGCSARNPENARTLRCRTYAAERLRRLVCGAAPNDPYGISRMARPDFRIYDLLNVTSGARSIAAGDGAGRAGPDEPARGSV